MEITSRRSFTKSIVGAIGAIPILSSLVEGQRKKRRISGKVKGRNKPKAISENPVDVRKEHDTPPPVLFMQGSFIVETAEADFDESDVITGTGMGSRKKYRRYPHETGKMKVHLAHLKVIDGSGEILYRNDNIMDDPHHPPMDLRVAVATEGGVVNIASVANNFELDIPREKKFEKVDKMSHPDDQPMGHKRMARFRYKDVSSGTEHRITGVKVTKGASMALFEINDLTDLPSKGEELRIMVWLEET